MKNKKYIEFFETKQFPLKNKQYIKGVKHLVHSETDTAYVLADDMSFSKVLEGKLYSVGEIEGGDYRRD